MADAQVGADFVLHAHVQALPGAGKTSPTTATPPPPRHAEVQTSEGQQRNVGSCNGLAAMPEYLNCVDAPYIQQCAFKLGANNSPHHYTNYPPAHPTLPHPPSDAKLVPCLFRMRFPPLPDMKTCRVCPIPAQAHTHTHTHTIRLATHYAANGEHLLGKTTEAGGGARAPPNSSPLELPQAWGGGGGLHQMRALWGPPHRL
jgi:hypothetical protein